MASLDPSTFREEDVPLSFDVVAALALAHSVEPESVIGESTAFDYDITVDVMDVLDQLQYDDMDSSDDSAAESSAPATVAATSSAVASPIVVTEHSHSKPPLIGSAASVPVSDSETEVRTAKKDAGLITAKRDTFDRSKSTGDAIAEAKKAQERAAQPGFLARTFGLGVSKERSATSTTDVTRSVSADAAATTAPTVVRSKSVAPLETGSKRSIETEPPETKDGDGELIVSRTSSVFSTASFDSSGDGDEAETVLDSEMYEIDSQPTLPLGVAPYAKDVASQLNSSEWEMTKYVLHRLGTSRQSIGDLDGRKLTKQQLLVKQKTGIKSHLLVSKGLDFSKVLYERRSTEVAFAEAQARQKKLEPISGFVTKHAGGKTIGMWKKRWLLCKRGYLLWAKKEIEIDNPAKVEERAKFLNSISMLRVHKAIKVNSKNGRKFNIIATKRVYRMRALSKKQRDDWVTGINEHLNTMQYTMKLIHGLSHFAPSLASKMAEQDTAEDDADGAIGDGFKKKAVISSSAADC